MCEQDWRYVAPGVCDELERDPWGLRMTLADFFAGAKVPDPAPQGPLQAPWTVQLAAEMREVVRKASQRAPRSQQVHLGPSEIGSECDREVAGKLAGLEATNHVTDPWPSVVGTAVHAWMEEAFTADGPRWLTERKVTPAPDAPARENGHTGTADLFDLQTATLIDHKILGRSTHDKLVRHGPPAHYRAQLLLYARGYRNAGVPCGAWRWLPGRARARRWEVCTCGASTCPPVRTPRSISS